MSFQVCCNFNRTDRVYIKLLLPSFTKEWIPIIRTSQTFLSLSNFIEKYNNIYDIECASYENIFYDESNDTNN